MYCFLSVYRAALQHSHTEEADHHVLPRQWVLLHGDLSVRPVTGPVHRDRPAHLGLHARYGHCLHFLYHHRKCYLL